MAAMGAVAAEGLAAGGGRRRQCARPPLRLRGEMARCRPKQAEEAEGLPAAAAAAHEESEGSTAGTAGIPQGRTADARAEPADPAAAAGTSACPVVSRAGVLGTRLVLADRAGLAGLCRHPLRARPRRVGRPLEAIGVPLPRSPPRRVAAISARPSRAARAARLQCRARQSAGAGPQGAAGGPRRPRRHASRPPSAPSPAPGASNFTGSQGASHVVHAGAAKVTGSR